LIPEAIVTIHRFRSQETKGTKTVVNCHRNNIILGIGGTIVKGTVTKTLLESTSMDPKVNWVASWIWGGFGGRIHREVEAVFRNAIDRTISRGEIANLFTTRSHKICCEKERNIRWR
jgi:hypothetical protein